MDNVSNITHNTSMPVKLSIVVPIYNVEQYLRKCVDSLLRQDYDNYEIILVDDGSPDRCPQICDKYAAEHHNVRAVHRENGGLSAARNAGTNIARGQYIQFVDSDDYIEPNVLGELMEQVEREQLDVLHFDYQNVRFVKDEGVNGLADERKYEVFQPYKFRHPVDKRTNVVPGEQYLNERMGYGCYACHFIIKREVVSTFTPGIHFEDTEWLPRMMLAAKRVNATTRIVYNYFWREGSITLTQGDTAKVRKNVEDVFAVIEHYNRYIAQYPDILWLKQMRSAMVESVLANVAQYLYSERKENIKRLKELKVFPLTLIAKQGKTYLRKAQIINISPRLAVEILHWKNRKYV